MDEIPAADRVLESCRQGDREAFSALFEAYKDRVHSIALVFFKGAAAAASDITQQVFLKLMSRIVVRRLQPTVRARAAEP